MAKLNEKQNRFCREYIIDLNATQAAIRAGYSEKTAYSIGQRLLKKVECQELIQELMDERKKRTRLTADDVLERIDRIAKATEAEQPGTSLKACELYGKHLRLFADRIETTNHTTIDMKSVDTNELRKMLEE